MYGPETGDRQNTTPKRRQKIDSRSSTFNALMLWRSATLTLEFKGESLVVHSSSTEHQTSSGVGTGGVHEEARHLESKTNNSSSRSDIRSTPMLGTRQASADSVRRLTLCWKWNGPAMGASSAASAGPPVPSNLTLSSMCPVFFLKLSGSCSSNERMPPPPANRDTMLMSMRPM